jgi:hypothetical protein
MVQPPFVRTGEDSLRPGKNPVVDQRPFDLDAAVVPGAAPVVTPWSIVLDAAVVLIAAAGAAGQTFRFEQDNPKKSSSQSYARYEVYKKKTTFSGLEGLRTLTLPGTKQEVFHSDVLSPRGFEVASPRGSLQSTRKPSSCIRRSMYSRRKKFYFGTHPQR